MSKTDQTHLDPEAIAKRAFEIWERDGRPDGRSDAHWAQAISELNHERAGGTAGARSPKPGAAKAAEKAKPASGSKSTAVPKAKAKSGTTTKRTVSKKKN
jgi:Protein of unknown function (DUF2934)